MNVPATQQQYDALYVGSDVEAELTLRRSQIYSRTYHSRCRAETKEYRFNNSLEWFDLMTDYLAVLKAIRANLSSESIHQLNTLVTETKAQVSF